MNDIAHEKKQLRAKMTTIRNQLSDEQRNSFSRQACDQLIELSKALSMNSVMVYIPFRSELDTWLYIEWCWHEGIEVLVPKVDAATRSMILYSLYNKQQLCSGAYGIMEPNPELMLPSVIVPDAVIVPGLAFNMKGHRLGYGGGYYDRYYEKLSHHSLWIGLAFEQQIIEKIPIDNYDIILNYLVSNKGIKTFS